MKRGSMLVSLAGLLAFAGDVAAQAPVPPTPPSPVNRLGFVTAGELADRCRESASASVTFCFSYIAAVRDTMRAYEIWLNQREFCEAGQLSQGDLRQAFVTFVNAYPSHRTGQAASVIVVALKQTYPCGEVATPQPTN
jgi:hypothetical protein